ncbi:MAG: heme lyase CcmF/NrfE family subunit, partial [Alphaproteobacteria bacterium]|nr:heme lyase CcmF/NrfE family subunit [Alphaproteobacteria bacterium]
SAKPLLYKFTGTWGNHEGSMLLWVWILALYGALVAAFGRNLPPAFRARVLGVQALIGLGFLVFVVATSNPFLRLDPAPPDGGDLNPLLQDPGLAFHPPLLYLGYVGLSMAFAFAVAALIEGRVDAAWARWVRPWTLLSWCALTAGIALGSWWAYYELGWGGFWFWDPVENASFMPWLMATALLHSSIVAEKRDALKSWTVLLAILAFSLSLLGTFLVRSGVLTSVHSFASDPARGIYILIFLVIVTGGSLTLYAWRAPGMRAGGSFRPLSREGSLLVNNLLLAVGCATVFIGTLYPLILDALADTKVSVGPPFFESTFVPLMIPLLLVMAAGPLMAWKRAGPGAVLRRLALSLVCAAAVAAAVAASGGGPWGAILGMALAGWVAAGVLAELAARVRLFRVPLAESARRFAGLPRAAWAMSIAHLGVAVLVAGTVGAGNWQSEREQAMHPGDTVALAGYEFALLGVGDMPGPNYLARRATVGVSRGGAEVALLLPERRHYPVQDTWTTEAAIHTTWLADLYVVVGADAPGGGTAIRIHHNPLVPWIWIGALVMVAGGAVSLSDRRHRVGAPVRRRRPAPAAAAAAGD